MARELKGTNSKKLKGKKKDKMVKTLKRMDKNREDDNTRLRHKLQEQISKHKADVVKADNFIKESNQKLYSFRISKFKIEGAIISLQEILSNETEPDSNN